MFEFFSKKVIDEEYEYEKVDWGWNIEFNNQEEKMLFEKYLALGESNWWVIKRDIKKSPYTITDTKEPYSAYENVVYVTVSIQWIKNCKWTVKKEFDNTKRVFRRCAYYKFDVLDNEEASKYIFNVAENYQKRIDDIKKAEEEAIQERERIEKENKESLIRIEKYLARINELEWSTWEFSEQFKILREIESIWDFNKKLLVSWKENIEKIHVLKKDFYNID